MHGRTFSEFELDARLKADCVASEWARAGGIFEFVEEFTTDSGTRGIVHNDIGKYFCWRPYIRPGDTTPDYWRVDCFMGGIATDLLPDAIRESLRSALIREGLCSEPLVMYMYKAEWINPFQAPPDDDSEPELQH